MDVGQRMYDLRVRKGLTAHELSLKVGVSQSYISLLENNKRRANVEVLAKIVEALGVTLGQFFVEDEAGGAAGVAGTAAAQGTGERKGLGINLDKLYKAGRLHAMAGAGGNAAPVAMRMIPVVSKVAAGDPAGYTDGEYPAGFAEEFVPAPADLDDPNAFALRIHGDSMTPRFRDGDIVICSPGGLPENGDAVVAKVNGDETTCKIYQLSGESVILSPVNTAFPVQIYRKDEIRWIYPVVVSQHREKR